MKLLSVGVQAPDFGLNDPGGNPHRLSDGLRAGPLILVFYKASCPTCQLTFPYLQKVFAEAGKVSACTIWGVSQDEREETLRFGGQFGLQFPLLVDEHPYAVSSAYGLELVPSVFIIESDGRIGLSDYGFNKATLSEISTKVAAFANLPPVPLFTPDDGLPAVRPG